MTCVTLCVCVLAVDILAEITQNSTFNEDAIERERGVTS